VNKGKIRPGAVPARAPLPRLEAQPADPLYDALEVALAAAREMAEPAPVEPVVADLQLLDRLASEAFAVVKRLAPQMRSPTMPQAVAFGAALKEARELVKARDDLLGGKGNGSGGAPERTTISIVYAEGVAPPDANTAQSPPELGAPASTTRPHGNDSVGSGHRQELVRALERVG
jgi:hypothetical protein